MAYCWKCGSIINASFCELCGCNQESRHNTSTQIGTRLRYAYDKLGPSEFLTSSIVFESASKDMLFDEPEICNQLIELVGSGFGMKLSSILRKRTDCISADECDELVETIQKCAGVNNTEARPLLIALLDMIGIEYNISSNVSQTWEPIERPPLREESKREISAAISSDKALLDIYGVGMSNVTFGGSGHAGPGGVLRVFNERIEFHIYYTAGKLAAFLGKTTAGKAAAQDSRYQDEAEEIIKISDIIRVESESFLGVHDLVIVLLNGTRYRVYDINAGKKSIRKLSDQINDMIERRR